jgi:cardiolipin synthase A/B
MIKPNYSEILVGGAEFWSRLREDIAAATTSIRVQTLSFEGDAAGLALAGALRASPCPDKRMLVDSFNQYFQNDRFIYAPHNARRPDLQAEVRATRNMIAELCRTGVQVRHTNPAGRVLHRLPARDHKKIVVIDRRVAYIGGINFSDHNFAWHDMMIRIDRADVAAALENDFMATWNGSRAPAVTDCTDIQLLSLTGDGNEETVHRVLDCITRARCRIYVMSPYMTFPFTVALRRAIERGVHVTVLTPVENNRGFLRTYMRAEAQACGIDLRESHGKMSHLKAMLIDDEVLIAGSSNFDWLTYHLLGEILIISRDRNTIQQFKQRVLQPDLQGSVPADGTAPVWKGALIGFLMRHVATLARAVCRQPKPTHLN